MHSSTQCLFPSDLSQADFQVCLALIKDGSAVNAARAEREFPEAMLISIRREADKIVGVGVVKMQRPDYASRIASPSKSNFNFDNMMHEIGYVSVKKDCGGRGHCQAILKSLLSGFSKRPVFATTFTPAMKHILGKNEFVQRGDEWEGDQGDYVSLWIKETS